MGDLPSHIGRYEILAPLGKGGMAEVFVGRATGEGGFERLVAVKRILPELAETPDFVEMFTDEARISAGLSHGNIGQVYEFGRSDDSYFIAMEYIQGVHLRKIYRVFGKAKKIPPPGLAAYVMANVCAALEHAHTRTDAEGSPQNIIHRDVSPSNVLVTFEGEIKLIDFGIARARQRVHETSASALKGKFAYMSPEQAFGRDLDHRSDIFCAGILLFELLTRCNPFEDDNDLSTLERVRKAKVIPPRKVVGDVPEELEAVCLEALQREPDDRFASAGEMQSALEAYHFKVGYGRQQLSGLMQEAFAEQREKTRDLLRRARSTDTAPGTATAHVRAPPVPDRKGRAPLVAAVAALLLAAAGLGFFLLSRPSEQVQVSPPAPARHTISVQTEAPDVRCVAALDGRPMEPMPCRFTANHGQQLKLQVTSGQSQLFLEQWTVDADRVIKVDLVSKTATRPPVEKEQEPVVKHRASGKRHRKTRKTPAPVSSKKKKKPRKPTAPREDPDSDDKEVVW